MEKSKDGSVRSKNNVSWQGDRHVFLWTIILTLKMIARPDMHENNV